MLKDFHRSPLTAHRSLFTIPAFAKINLSLRVLGKRTDGFHEICTTFQTISLHDDLSFEPADEITFTCDDKTVPLGDKNIIVRAAALLREISAVKQGAKIHLVKRIPSPGGLGGGSANAAVTLLALKQLWQLEITFDELIKVASALGADVPFFLFGGTAFAIGLGTEIEPLPDCAKEFLLIVTPNENVSTATAYQSLKAVRLTDVDPLVILTLCRSARIAADNNQAERLNDFENTIFRLRPEIERVKRTLLKSGASAALMSGSGASVFGIFDNETARQTALSLISETKADWRIFVCETISRGEYQKRLAPCASLSGD